MRYRLLADALVVFHLAFIVFAVGGGLLVLARPWVAWLHVPAALWATGIEFSGALCPLTPWEQALRVDAGQAGYAGSFIEHYLLPLIYPAGLTPRVQIVLGAAVLALNVAVYAVAWRRAYRRRLAAPGVA